MINVQSNLRPRNAVDYFIFPTKSVVGAEPIIHAAHLPFEI